MGHCCHLPCALYECVPHVCADEQSVDRPGNHLYTAAPGRPVADSRTFWTVHALQIPGDYKSDQIMNHAHR